MGHNLIVATLWDCDRLLHAEANEFEKLLIEIKQEGLGRLIAPP